MRILDPDGPLMGGMSKLADVIIINIMFVILSLPVFTVGAALSALFTCAQQMVTDQEDELIFRIYWRAFRKNFRQGTLLWLVCLAAGAFLFAYYFVIQNFTGVIGRLYQITFYLLVILFLFGGQYIFPLQARYQNKVKYTLRNAWLLSIAALPWSVAALLVLAAALIITLVMNKGLYMAIYIWGIAGFALVGYLQSFFYRRAFLKVSPELLAPKSTETAQGALFTDEEHRKDDLMVEESRFSDPNWNRREDLFGPNDPEKRKKRR